MNGSQIRKSYGRGTYEQNLLLITDLAVIVGGYLDSATVRRDTFADALRRALSDERTEMPAAGIPDGRVAVFRNQYGKDIIEVHASGGNWTVAGYNDEHPHAMLTSEEARDALATLEAGRLVERHVNLTPHAVTVYDGDRVVMDLLPSGIVARVKEKAVPEGWDAAGIERTAVLLSDVESLPAPKDGTTYVVSMPLMMALKASGVQRTDVVYPYGQVRDDAGRIIGCRSLGRIH